MSIPATTAYGLKMHPELLMAACHGDFEQIKDLLSWEDARVVHCTLMEPQVIVEIDHSTPSAVPLLLRGVTLDGDSALHIVATVGDDDKHTRSVKAIHYSAKHLLDAVNNGGNTPLHCAARAGNIAVLSLLIELARGGEGGDERVKAVLRMQNNLGETALHEAIRAAHIRMVNVLLKEDPCLARVPDKATSPLFLAILLEQDGIAKQLFERDSQLSYSGPDGQNALHAAVLRSKEMTKLLLGWNKDLTKQRDQHGRTPLHFAVSLENNQPTNTLPQHAISVEKGVSMAAFFRPLIVAPTLDLTKELLEVDASSAFQPDNIGLYPIHVAALAANLAAIVALVTRCPGCAALSDIKGRTFLHLAVWKKRYDIVAYACQTPALSKILNKQDNEGNTALHLAVQVGDWKIFASLFMNRQVELNLTNNRQYTPRELSVNSIPTGLYYVLNSQILIQQALISAGAKCISHGWDGMKEENNPQTETDNELKYSEKISSSTQFLGIGSVLITTMAFGATFALPGGYRADDHTNGGTPTLVGSRLFHGFLMANTLAFMCSSLAVMSLVYAGTPTIELPIRYLHYGMSLWLSLSSAEALCTAFAIAVYMMIAPVAFHTAIAIIVVIVLAGILYLPAVVLRLFTFLPVLVTRLGTRPFLGSDLLKIVFLSCWPFIVIFGCQEFAWRHR